MRSCLAGAHECANRKLNRTLISGCRRSEDMVVIRKNNKGFKGQKGEQCHLKCIMQLCSCREPKRKRGFGHLLFFRNPCRGRNLLNNNVTFIQWDMTFKNKGRWRVSLCSVAQIQNTEFELNVTPSAFVSTGPFVVIATTFASSTESLLNLYDFSTQTENKTLKLKIIIAIITIIIFIIIINYYTTHRLIALDISLKPNITPQRNREQSTSNVNKIYISFHRWYIGRGNVIISLFYHHYLTRSEWLVKSIFKKQVRRV